MSVQHNVSVGGWVGGVLKHPQQFSGGRGRVKKNTWGMVVNRPIIHVLVPSVRSYFLPPPPLANVGIFLVLIAL